MISEPKSQKGLQNDQKALGFPLNVTCHSALSENLINTVGNECFCEGEYIDHLTPITGGGLFGRLINLESRLINLDQRPPAARRRELI